MLSIFDTSPELAQSGFDTAVLAVGSIEPKGPHLPVGLDMLLANRFARDFCAGKAVYLLPVFPYSMAMETRGFRGTVALRQQTLWNVLFDIARLVARHDFKRLVVLDFSNYNWILKHAVREINLRDAIVQTVWVSPKEFAREAAEDDLLPDYGGGALETSLALALDEKLVRPAPPDFDAGVPREYIDYAGLAAVAPEGYWGKPSKATSQLGDKFYKIMLDKTREFIDYSLGLFPGGAPLADDERGELWWPQGEIPGVKDGFDWHSTLSEIKGSGADIAIVPTGATEQHSTAQPLGADYFQCLEVARRAAAELGAYLLPALPVVTSWGHIHFRGTVTFSAMTVRRILTDVVASLHEGGFRKVLIVNVHGGNWVIKPTIIEISHTYRDMRIITTGDILAYRGQAPMEDLHAAAGDATFIRAFYPEAFKEDRVVDFSPMCPASALDTVGVAGVSPQGVWGYPSKTTAQQGRDRMNRRIEALVPYVKKAFGDLEGPANPGDK